MENQTDVIETDGQEVDHILPDGVYFDMDEDVYHALPHFSASGAKDMLVSPATYWAGSGMNPKRKVKSTDAYRYGSAFHTAVLEPDLLAAKYCSEFTKNDMPPGPGCLTDQDMKDALADMGLPKTQKGETVAELADRLLGAGYGFPIWHIWEKQWRESVGDRTVLKGDEWEDLMRDQASMLGVPEVAELFRDGYAEVSVLWTCPDAGIKMKARMDYLKVEGFNDLKTYANSKGKHWRQNLIDVFRFNKIYIQWVNYWQAYEMIRAGLPAAEGSTLEQGLFIEEIQRHTIPGECHFWFLEKGGIPNAFKVTPRIFGDRCYADESGAIYFGDYQITEKQLPEMRHSDLFNRGKHDLMTAKMLYKQHMDHYGDAGEPWRPINPEVEITDADYSDFFLDAEDEQNG